MSEFIKKGTTSKSIPVEIFDSSVSTGAGKTGLAYNTSGLTAYYWREGGSPTQITLATLSAVDSAYSSGGFKEVDATNMPGLYRLDVPNAAFASGAGWVTICLKGATNMAENRIFIKLTDFDPNDSVRMGLTALPNATAGGSGGVLINGSNTGTVALSAVTISGGLTITQSTADTPAVSITGNGSGQGVYIIGGASGGGLVCYGKGGQPGLRASAWDTGDGAIFSGGTGSYHGIRLTAGSTGHGLRIAGGSTSGEALVITNTSGNSVTITSGGGNGDGVEINGHGSGSGVDINAGASGSGFDVAGGSTSGSGIRVNTSSGHGITVTAVGASSDGFIIVGERYDLNADIQGAVSSIGAADIRTAVGLASANLDTQLAAIDDYIDSEVSAIKTKTDALPSWPTNFASLSIDSNGKVALSNPAGIQKNTALSNFNFVLVDSSGVPVTGATVTATRSIDGGSFASCANSASEVGSGVYKINLAAADLNGDVVTLKFAATGASTRLITIFTEP